MCHELISAYDIDKYDTDELLSLCAASRIWVMHQSVVIVRPEGGLEFSAGLTKKDCVLFMSRLKIVSGLPYKIVIESWNTHASSSSQEALLLTRSTSAA